MNISRISWNDQYMYYCIGYLHTLLQEWTFNMLWGMTQYYKCRSWELCHKNRTSKAIHWPDSSPAISKLSGVLPASRAGSCLRWASTIGVSCFRWASTWGIEHSMPAATASTPAAALSSKLEDPNVAVAVRLDFLGFVRALPLRKAIIWF